MIYRIIKNYIFLWFRLKEWIYNDQHYAIFHIKIEIVSLLYSKKKYIVLLCYIFHLIFYHTSETNKLIFLIINKSEEVTSVTQLIIKVKNTVHVYQLPNNIKSIIIHFIIVYHLFLSVIF